MVGTRITGIVIGLITLSVAVFAQGNTVFDFLRNDAGARAAALGGSFLSASDDPNVIFYNPANLTTLTTKRLSIGFFKQLLDINSGYASFGMEVQDFGFVGAGIIYTNYGDFPRRGEEMQDLGTFSAGEFAMSIGYAGKYNPDLSYGTNLKIIYSSIAEYSSYAAAIDLGVNYIIMPGRLVGGASILNLGTQIDPYASTREELPFDCKIGVAIYPEHLPASILIDLHKLNESQDNFINHFKQFSVGVEFTASPNVQFRFGYNNEHRQEWRMNNSAGMAGFSIGGGFMTDVYVVDYAYNSMGKIGSLHRINIGLKL
jgi:hypothetical protein